MLVWIVVENAFHGLILRFVERGPRASLYQVEVAHGVALEHATGHGELINVADSFKLIASRPRIGNLRLDALQDGARYLSL